MRLPFIIFVDKRSQIFTEITLPRRRNPFCRNFFDISSYKIGYFTGNLMNRSYSEYTVKCLIQCIDRKRNREQIPRRYVATIQYIQMNTLRHCQRGGAGSPSHDKGFLNLWLIKKQHIVVTVQPPVAVTHSVREL